MTAPFVVGRRRVLSDRAVVAVALAAGLGARAACPVQGGGAGTAAVALVAALESRLRT